MELSGTFPGAPAITMRMRDSGAPSDADLMGRTAAGDRDAFAALYKRHHAAVFRFARLMTGSDGIAEDVVQDVFLGLMRGASRYDAERSSLTTYLYGAARHHTRRHLTRERRFVSLEPDEPALGQTPAADDVHGAVARRGDVQWVRRAILALPSRYREVIVLCDLQDVSYADAATTLGCAVGTVRSRLHRARQLLAVKMTRAGARAEVASRAMRCAV